MKPVKTHKFKLGKYKIVEGDGWIGLTDIPDRYDTLRMEVLTGKSVKALAVQIHEALHAEDCPMKFLHQDEDPCDNIARFLVRMGWVRICDSAAPPRQRPLTEQIDCLTLQDKARQRKLWLMNN